MLILLRLWRKKTSHFDLKSIEKLLCFKEFPARILHFGESFGTVNFIVKHKN